MYYQPQTRWSAPTPLSSSFDSTVELIIRHRKANPAVVAKNNLSLNFDTVANELEAYTRKRLGLPASLASPIPKTTPLRRLADGVGAAVEGVKRLAAGAALLFEWEESKTEPVANELAAKRAEICVRCPKNDPEHMSKYFTTAVSEMLRKKLQRLHEMKLTTVHDQQLGICAACFCPLKLKVFCPFDLIEKHIRQEDRPQLDPQCWILKRDA